MNFLKSHLKIYVLFAVDNSFFKRFYSFFRERGREGEREGTKPSMCERDIISCLLHAHTPARDQPATQAWALTENLTQRPCVLWEDARWPTI